MFEEFDPKTTQKDKRRLGASLAVSGVVYLSLAAGVVAASAAARQVVKEEELVQVEFALPPEPEPPPPEPEPAPTPPPAATPPSPRPKTQRKTLEAPKETPKEKPPESDRPLSDAPPPGSGQDGFTDGAPGGTGKAPAPPPPPPPAPSSAPVHLPEKATPPVAKSGNAAPAYPEEARKAGLQAVVVAKVTISREGSVTGVDILRGPEIFHAPVKAALMTWRYEPARLPDGTAISVFRIVQLPFKLENM